VVMVAAAALAPPESGGTLCSRGFLAVARLFPRRYGAALLLQPRHDISAGPPLAPRSGSDPGR
ncbi:MAG: hypothetical protein ABR592_02465, partial [Nitriliruptorales bacterium]